MPDGFTWAQFLLQVSLSCLACWMPGTACSALCSLSVFMQLISTLQVQKKLKLAAVDSVFLASVGASD